MPNICDTDDGFFAVNYKECLLTRIQKISLDYHFKVEQEAGSSVHGFFGFNGSTDDSFSEIFGLTHSNSMKISLKPPCLMLL